MSDTCSLFPPFGDPWPSCLLPSHFCIPIKTCFPLSLKDVRSFLQGCPFRLTYLTWSFPKVAINSSKLSKSSPISQKGTSSWSIMGIPMGNKIVFSFGHTTQPVGSWFSNQGTNPNALVWKHRVLTTGLPGKSPETGILEDSEERVLDQVEPIFAFEFPKTISGESKPVAVKSLSHVWLFCDPMDCSTPGPSVRGILQARILE